LALPRRTAITLLLSGVKKTRRQQMEKGLHFDISPTKQEQEGRLRGRCTSTNLQVERIEIHDCGQYSRDLLLRSKVMVGFISRQDG
jgi:hypothetical protein